MRINLSPDNEDNIIKLMQLLNSSGSALVNYFVRESLKLIAKDLIEGIPPKYKDLIIKEIQNTKTKKSP